MVEKKICVISDVDGCLTDGNFIYTVDGKVAKIFGPHDNDGVKLLAKNNINMRALSIAETEDFGILRLIVNDVVAAEKLLTEAGYLIKVTDVVGVKIGDAPGKLTEALKILSENKINLEYLYAFMARTERHAYVVLRVEDNDLAKRALTTSGFHIITGADVDKL